MALPAAPLGQLLVDMGVVSSHMLGEMLAAQRSDRRRLGELLVDRGLVRPQQLAQILSHQLSCPWVSLQRVEIGQSVLALLPRDLALELQVVPVHLRMGDTGRTLYVATADPTDVDALGACSRAAAMTVKPMVAMSTDIRAALMRLYGDAPSPARKPSTPKLKAGDGAPRKPMPSSEALELDDDGAGVVEAAPAELQQAAVLTLNAPPRFLEQCRAAVSAHDGVVVDGAFTKAADLVIEHLPCAIVVTDDVYAFDRAGLNRLALDHDAVLVVWSEDVEAKQLEPLLGGAIKRWRKTPYEKGSIVDGRYELLRDLGGPVPASRWEVRHTRTKRRAILHVAPGAKEGEDTGSVKRQESALARVGHPGAIDLRDAGVTDRGDPYVVLEELEGKTLEGLLAARGKIPAPDACAVLVQIADVLAASHAAGVLHNDVRPENIVVATDAFGVERARLSGWQSARVVEGETLDPRSDVLALGLVVFEALVGREPKPDEQIDDGAELPPDVARMLERATSAQAETRFANVAELAAAIERAEPHARDPSHLVEARRAAHSGRPPALGGAEQRKHPRAAYRTPVRIEVPGVGAIDGRTEDISLGGIFVVTRARVRISVTVTVRFALPIDGKVVSEPATARWSRDARMGEGAGLFAVGLELASPGAETKGQIERYVALMGAPAT
jgi:hypothetical protein